MYHLIRVDVLDHKSLHLSHQLFELDRIHGDWTANSHTRCITKREIVTKQIRTTQDKDKERHDTDGKTDRAGETNIHRRRETKP
jgi:hypothetical protein